MIHIAYGNICCQHSEYNHVIVGKEEGRPQRPSGSAGVLELRQSSVQSQSSAGMSRRLIASARTVNPQKAHSAAKPKFQVTRTSLPLGLSSAVKSAVPWRAQRLRRRCRRRASDIQPYILLKVQVNVPEQPRGPAVVVPLRTFCGRKASDGRSFSFEVSPAFHPAPPGQKVEASIQQVR